MKPYCWNRILSALLGSPPKTPDVSGVIVNTILHFPSLLQYNIFCAISSSCLLFISLLSHFFNLPCWMINIFHTLAQTGLEGNNVPSLSVPLLSLRFSVSKSSLISSSRTLSSISLCLQVTTTLFTKCLRAFNLDWNAPGWSCCSFVCLSISRIPANNHQMPIHNGEWQHRNILRTWFVRKVLMYRDIEDIREGGSFDQEQAYTVARLSPHEVCLACNTCPCCSFRHTVLRGKWGHPICCKKLQLEPGLSKPSQKGEIQLL